MILDELGSGTDPAEGMGIAIAILEQLRASGMPLPGHHPLSGGQDYAGRHAELISARMAFDREKPASPIQTGDGKDRGTAAPSILQRGWVCRRI